MRYSLGILIAAAALAQSYQARHDHWRGSCEGPLTFDNNGARFESRTKPKHSWRSSYLEAQQVMVLDSGEFRLLTYQDRPWRLGEDREHRLRVGDKQFAAQVGPVLAARLDRRLVAGLAEPPAKPLWEIPAKHLLRFSGSQGTLVVAEDRVVYRADRKGDSRSWRLADIESVSSSGPDQLTITTYERARAHYGDRKGFNFRLKQPLDPDRYNDLWRRLEKSKGLRTLGE